MKDCWNPWHGCTKYSEGCENCYVYRRDSMFGKDASVVEKTSEFGLPLARDRKGEYRLAPGSRIFVCMTSDFFLDKADVWRGDAWGMIRKRSDVHFSIITKRVLRIRECLPEDWGAGWDNVSIGATIENMKRANERMDEFLGLPLKDRFIICEPMLEYINIQKWLAEGKISSVTAGGESGTFARPLDYDWVLSLRQQCIETGTAFRFKQTGARFIKEGKLYNIERALQIPQARRAGIDTESPRR